ncbi:MAG: pectate lyase [Planctomycetales bacterium]|nr:pectate lyase [Planctomycetales bacterium]
MLAALPAQAQHGDRWEMRWGRVMRQPVEWYGSEEAIRIADNVLAYQHPTGGWPKNIDMARKLSAEELDKVRRDAPGMQPIIDNGATHTQVRYLARVYQATSEDRFRDALLRGVDYLLEAQYPSGGWPMMHPLRRGYYSDITFNDGAMIGTMSVLRDAASGKGEWAAVDPPRRRKAAAAVERGIDVILKCQVKQGGHLTVWCAQHDPHDLHPTKARSYELPSLSGQESVGIVQFLMSVEQPSPEIVNAIESAVAWFERTKVTGLRVEFHRGPDGPDRVAVEDLNAPPLWARFYDLETNQPMYVSRDGTVHETYNEIDRERRLGYSYLGPYAGGLLKRDYPKWKKRLEVDAGN